MYLWQVITVLEYITEAGRSPFGRWFSGLKSPAAAKVTTALERITQGNFSNAKALGAGLSEYKIDFGPGYRIYFGKDGETLVILLAGGSKKGSPRYRSRAGQLGRLQEAKAPKLEE